MTNEVEVARCIHSGLPTPTYLDFVEQHLSYSPDQESVINKRIDPFDLDVDFFIDRYVERTRVEKELGLYGATVIVGNEGSGKTTLFQKLLRDQTSRMEVDKILVLGISMSRVEISDQDNVLSPSLVSQFIFQSYWDYLWENYQETLWSGLRNDLDWMRQFRWFYQRFRPNNPTRYEDYTLISWLNAQDDEPFSAQSNSIQSLINLVNFIVIGPNKSKVAGRKIRNLFRGLTKLRIELLIDEIEELPSAMISVLLQDARRLLMICPQLKMKLFVDVQREKLVKDCFRRRVKIYKLPPWKMEELTLLLKRRVKVLVDGCDDDVNWAKESLTSYLQTGVEQQMIDIIVQGALKAYEKRDKLDAPIHALKLSRGLVAGCAGTWRDLGYDPPLSLNQIQTFVNIYWDYLEASDGF